MRNRMAQAKAALARGETTTDARALVDAYREVMELARIKTIGDLVKQPEDKLLAFKNFGKKSLNEIKKKLTELGKSKNLPLSLGMDLSQILKKKEEE